MLEQKLHRIWATQENSLQLVVSLSFYGTKGSHLWTWHNSQRVMIRWPVRLQSWHLQPPTTLQLWPELERSTLPQGQGCSLPDLPQRSDLSTFQFAWISFWLHKSCVCFPESLGRLLDLPPGTREPGGHWETCLLNINPLDVLRGDRWERKIGCLLWHAS